MAVCASWVYPYTILPTFQDVRLINLAPIVAKNPLKHKRVFAIFDISGIINGNMRNSVIGERIVPEQWSEPGDRRQLEAIQTIVRAQVVANSGLLELSDNHLPTSEMPLLTGKRS